MKNAGNHIIHKVSLEIETKSEEKATQIKNNASLFLQEDLFPVLEELLDKYDVAGQIIRLDKLDVDFSISDWTNREAIKFEFVKSVEQKLSEIEPDIKSYLQGERYFKDEKSALDLAVTQTIKTEQNYRETFLFFLENGYLTWYGKQEYVQLVVEPANWQIHLENQYFVSAIKRLLLKNSLIIERMVLQFSNETILELIQVFYKIEVRTYSGLLAYLNKLETEERNLLLKYVLKYSIEQSESESIQLVKKLSLFERLIHLKFEAPTLQVTNEQVHQFLAKKETEFNTYFEPGTYVKLFTLTNQNRKELIENKSTIISKEFANSEQEKEPTFFVTETNQIIVRNAGLVLFHPFFKTLFKRFNWISENGKIKEDERLKAVQTLHYCATGNEEFFEAELILEKFLCGLPLQIPIPVRTLLTVKIKEEADNMLKAVVGNWPALKNTSPEGLRQMFVQRDGKLVQIEKGTRLIVERKAQDILLDKLPWNISIVKLPWKDDLLFVEW